MSTFDSENISGVSFVVVTSCNSIMEMSNNSQYFSQLLRPLIL